MSKHKGRGKEFRKRMIMGQSSRNAGISCGGPPRQSTMRLRSVSVTMSIFYDCEMLVGRTSAGSNRIVEYRMKRSI